MTARLKGGARDLVAMRLHPTLLERLTIEAKRQNRSRSNLVESLLEKGLGKAPQPSKKREQGHDANVFG